MMTHNEYGKALFLLAEEDGAIDTVRSDVSVAYSVLSSNPEYVKILDTPAISKEEKLALADEAFSTLSDNVKNLIKILCEKRSVHTFPDIYATYNALYNERMGIVDVEAVTAIPMSASQLNLMRDKLENMTGKTIIIKNTVDPTILGGVKLRYLGIQIDGSVKTKLDSFAESLKNIVI